MGTTTTEVPRPPALFLLDRVAVRDEGAFGVLKYKGLPFAVTLERTYPGPAGEHIVKIPPGRHLCMPTLFHGGKPVPYATFEIIVEGHARLLFHKGNTEDDSEGCILVAEGFDKIRGVPGIASSSAGFTEFMRHAGNQSFELEVREWRDA